MFRFCTICGLLAMMLAGFSAGSQAGMEPGYPYVPGQILVKFKAATSSQDKGAILAPMKGAKVRDFSGIGYEQWQLKGTTVAEAIAQLEADPRVDLVEPNYLLHALEVPDDPRFPDLWGMNNTGQTGGVSDADIDAVEAWDVFTGSRDVLVAVIDSGVDYNHPDLVANIWTNPLEIAGNGIDDDNNGFIDDIHGWDFANGDADPMDDNDHGSHCSGTIGGVGNNGEGVTGVNWEVSIMALKFLDSSGTGSTADAISCMEYATAAGVDVMSNSWGGGPYDAAMEAAIEAANQAGIFFVAAAGNDGTDNDSSPHYPSNYTNDNVIAVMATDDTDNPVNEPGWWATDFGATSVDIAAPGLHIWSTTPGNTYSDFSGTSMATPHVSGALAMLRGRFPNISVADGKNLLLTIGNDPLASLAGKCVSGGRLNLLKLIAEPDTIPPSGVGDLAVSQVATNWVELAWTAPGDDGTVGTTSSYDVRWSLTNILDETDWDAAQQATGEPDPGVYGTAETMQVGGLDPLTPYYFCIRAKDEYGNLGSLSNVPTGTTLAPPTIAVAPASLASILDTGGSEVQTLTVTNAGEGVLDFHIPNAEYILPDKAPAAPVQTYPYLKLAKGAVDSRPAMIPGDKALGGPDAFGYNWRDSDEPGGPVFNWVEIDTLGTAVTLSDDQNSGPHAIGFPFSYYGNDFTEFQICSNGWISFTDTSDDMSNGPLPSTGSPKNMLALFWDDLNPDAGGDVYYYGDGSRLIVEYKNVPHYDSGGVYTMQVQLYANGSVEYHYLDMGTINESGTIGIQNGDGTDGLTVVFNGPYVHDNLAVRFGAVTPWLSTGPSSGSLAAGASVDVYVGISAAGLCGSHFDANLHVLSNDPVTPDVVVPVGLDVTGMPDIAVDPAALDFGPVYITATGTLSLNILNNGCADLNLSAVSTDQPDFAVTLAVPVTVPAGGSETATMVFTPTVAGPASGSLTIISDDPDTPNLLVPLSGTGLDFPDIAVAPDSLSEFLPSGGTASHTLTVTNNGLGDLNFTIPEPEYLSAAKVARPVGRNAQPITLDKDAKDPRVGAPVLLGTGGPDLFGYRWKDSDEPGGPSYNWIEIESVGTSLGLDADDQNVGPFPLGFSFPFYGNDFTEIRACSNGWLSFTSSATAYANYELPSTSAPENLLAVFHDDLTFSSAGSAYYYNDGTRFIVEYKDVPRYLTDELYTFQVQLYPSGRIEYHYQSMQGTRLNEATIGIQNAAGDDGLTVVFNAAYVHDAMAIRFEAQTPWLAVIPGSGTVSPGDSAEVTVNFDAAGLCGDQYLANLHVLSNDPDTPDVMVPVTLDLDGQPDAVVSATDLDFGPVQLTESETLPLTLANAGCASLGVSDLSVDNPVFTLDTTAPFSVSAGSAVAMNITFTPATADTARGVVTITTDDPDQSVFLVDVVGVGLDIAQISVTPADIFQGVRVDGTATRTLTIANTGAVDLMFDIPSPDMYSKAVAELGNLPPVVTVEKPKGSPDDEFGITPLGSGGPDTYGYLWNDSDEPGGPVFNWIDISSTGTLAMSGGDDANLGPFPIGFTFNFYDTPFTQFRVCSNGWMSFDSSQTSFSNVALPSANAPANLIAPFWDDLNLDDGGDVYYEVVDGKLVVMFDGVMPYGSSSGTGPFTYEVILYPSGIITLQYLTLVGSPGSYTVGIQDGTRTVGLNIAYNTSYLHDNMAIRIQGALNWLSCDPVSGTVPPGGSMDVAVNFDAAGMDEGQHDGMITVQSNDPQMPTLQVPVTMMVSDLSAVVGPVLPTVLTLQQNAPNPFNPMTTVKFALPRSGPVQLNVYNIRGALVRTLVSSDMEAGYHEIVWKGRDDQDHAVSSGVYFYRLKTADEVLTRRMTMIK